MGHSKGSPERDVHTNTGLPSKDRNNSNKQPNPMPTGTGGTTTNTAQSKQKEGNNQYQSRVKRTETKRTILKVNESRDWFFQR